MNTTIIPDLRPEGWTDEDLAYRPEVVANAPAWCNRISVHFEDDGTMGIGYDYRRGSVELGTAAHGVNGRVAPADDGQVFLYFSDDIAVTPEALRQYAADFLAAADALENGARR